MSAQRAAAIERFALSAWILFELGKGAQLIWANGAFAADFIVLASMAVLLVNTMRRPAPSHYRADWRALAPCLISLSVMTAALAVSRDGDHRTVLTDGLELVGATGMLWSAWSLGRSFTLLPATIEPIERGAYRFVRHPLYASYLIYDVALAIQYGAWIVWAAVLCEALALSLRAHQEEQMLLIRFPGYADYMRRVRGRYLPYLL